MEDPWKTKKLRWSATYTKHIKQKRKVYQDGFLDLHIPTNKAMLLDDCEKPLECRILKDEEVVVQGGTLSFHSYLVDVGDPEGCASVDSKCVGSGRESGGGNRPVVTHRRKLFKSPSICSGEDVNMEDGKGNLEKKANNLSPSMKIIREYKKNEIQRYGAPRSGPDAVQSAISEWQVLYTAQVTQKARKYHDGFLQLSTRGSGGRRQVMLYDASKKLLTSRFLKTDETIRTGESIFLDGYLVDVGEPEVERKNIRQGHGNTLEKTKTVRGQQNSLNSAVSVGKEWQAMYTTQVTQKAKKYHDGFLKLANCGSLARQIRLYDASRQLLDSRFLKKDEIIRSGESIAFEAHLVDIGEPVPENQHASDLIVEGTNSNVVDKSGIMYGQPKYLKADKSVSKGKDHNCAFLGENADSDRINGVDETKLGGFLPSIKPLRDACQILSILQKPKSQESITVVPVRDDEKLNLPVSFANGFQVPDTEVDLAEDLHSSKESSRNHRSNESVDIGESTIFASSSDQYPVDSRAGISDELYLGKVEAGAKSCGGVSSTANPPSPPRFCDYRSESLEQLIATGTMDECPTFDLRF